MSYSMSKAAKVAGVSKTTMHKWVKSGKVTSTKLNDGTYSIEESELTRVIESRKQVISTTVIQPVNTGNTSLTSEPLNLSIYSSNTLNEVKYAAALEAVSHERELLRQQVNELRQRSEAAEARSEAAAERYHDSIKTITKLLEDKRETPQRKKFLGMF